MRKIILLSGWATSGKDLLADFLLKNKGYTQFAFAISLKKQVSDHYNFDYNLTLSQEGKNKKIGNYTIRELLISYAKIERNKNQDVFAQYTSKEIKLYDSYKNKRGEQLSDIVISDVRYHNEIDFIKKQFYNNSKIITIRLNRHLCSPINSESETQLDDYKFDYTIENKGTKLDLYNSFINLKL